MRRNLICGGVAAVVLAMCGTASAQDAWNRGGTGGSASNGSWVKFQGGLFSDTSSFAAEVGSISTTGTPGPDTESEANTNMSYEIGHQMLGVLLGMHMTPPQVKGLEIEFGVFLGSASMSTELDVDEGSALLPAGNPMDDSHQTMADRNGDLAFGFHLRGLYLIKDIMIVGLDYQFLSGSGEVNNDVFFNDTVDGDLEFMRHRINLLVGAQLGPVRPYLGLGFLVYEANADLTEADDPTGPDTWDVDFEPKDTFRMFLGAEIVQGILGARFDLHLLPGIGASFSIFVRV